MIEAYTKFYQIQLSTTVSETKYVARTQTDTSSPIGLNFAVYT
jgi:hypothetical protein